MKVLIAGGGIGRLATALSLNAAGIDVEVYDKSREFRQLGLGINLLPHAVKHVQHLPLLPALDRAGIRSRCVIFATRWGNRSGTSCADSRARTTRHNSAFIVVDCKASCSKLRLLAWAGVESIAVHANRQGGSEGVIDLASYLDT